MRSRVEKDPAPFCLLLEVQCVFILFILICVLIGLALILLAVLFTIGLCRTLRPIPADAVPPSVPQEYARLIREGVAWFRSQSTEPVSITSYDGLRLDGLLLPAETERTRGTLILVHGWRSSGYNDFSGAYQYYHDLGFRILNIFQRAHGTSQGRFTCFGVKERYDCQSWARYIQDRFGPEEDIFFSGISMGASAVLLAAGLELPANVRGIVADCGFTSAWDEFAYVLPHYFHLPARPILDIEDLLCRLIAGFGFRDCSVPESLAQATIPVLFIHGGADDFVPTEMGRRNYQACVAPKDLVIVEGAGHGLSYVTEQPRVQSAMENWFSKWGTFSEYSTSK